MRRNWPTLLGYLALALALLALVLRVSRGRVNDWTDYMAPLAISLMIVAVILRERKQRESGPHG